MCGMWLVLLHATAYGRGLIDALLMGARRRPGHATSKLCLAERQPKSAILPQHMSVPPHLLLLPEPDQLQHEHVLVTLEGINLINHATIVTQLQQDTDTNQTQSVCQHTPPPQIS